MSNRVGFALASPSSATAATTTIPAQTVDPLHCVRLREIHKLSESASIILNQNLLKKGEDSTSRQLKNQLLP